MVHEQSLWIPTVPSSDDASGCDNEDFTPRCTKEVVEELIINSLPKSQHLDKAAKQQSVEHNSLETLSEGIEEEEGLQNAWQYSKKVQEERSGIKRQKDSKSSIVFCHSFNLAGRLKDQLKDVLVHTEEIDYSTSGARKEGLRYFLSLRTRLETLLSRNRVVRMLLLHPHPPVLSVALILLLSHIRSKNLPVVVLVAVQPWRLNETSIREIQHVSDVVLEAEGFVGRGTNYPPPAEFSDFHGLLHIRRASTVTAATASGHFADLTVSKRPAANVYGLKRDSRKLHISLLHIPPEDFAAGGGSVGSGVRSGAGKTQQAVGGCSSAAHLEF